MAPTIQTALNPEKRPTVGLGGRTGEKRSELVCRVKYCNTLPDIPFDPKFITYPFDSSRFIQYNPTSLERNYKYDILTEHDLGVTIDLINRELYSGEFGAQLDAADEKLLEEDVLTPQDSKRSRHHARSVSWLRRTEYISTEQTRFQPQTMDKVEAKVGYSIKKNFKDETLYMDRDSQIKAIGKTFEDAKIPIEKHYSKPNVVPLEILPVFPDFKVWKYPCAQVIFDSDPAPTGRSLPAQIEEMSQAMIRGVMDESGEQFVAYFLPTDETMEKRRRDFTNSVEYEDEEEYEYKMAREYNWNVKSKASKGYEENYFLVIRPDGVYYNELETRVRLSKRRQKPGQPPNNTRLVVQHRTLNAPEYHGQRYRERQLEPPGEEDEEEEEQMEVEETAQNDTDAGKKSDDAVKDSSDKGDGDGNKSDAEASGKETEGGGSDDEGARSKSSGSRNSSRGSNKSSSRSRSASPAKSVQSRKKSSRSRSRSVSVAKSGRSRSGSGSPAKTTRSHSGSRSRSGSPEKSGRSRSGTPDRSERSRSGSPEKSGRSRSGSPEKSGRSRSGSPEKSGRSRSGSPAKSGRSRSGSPEKSGRSRSGSPAKSGRSRSGSPEKSGRSRSGSPEKSGRSRSGSPEKSGRSRSGSPEKSERSRTNSPATVAHSRSRSRSVAKSNKSSGSGSGSSSGSASESEG